MSPPTFASRMRTLPIRKIFFCVHLCNPRVPYITIFRKIMWVYEATIVDETPVSALNSKMSGQKMFGLLTSYWRRKITSGKVALKSPSWPEFYDFKKKFANFSIRGMIFGQNVIFTKNVQKWPKMVEIQNFFVGWNRLELSYFGCQEHPVDSKNANFWCKKPTKKIKFLLGVKFPMFTFWPRERPRVIFNQRQGTQAPYWSWLTGWTVWHLPTKFTHSRIFRSLSRIVC